MPNDSPGKNVVQFVKCRNCGERFRTRVQTRAGLCPACESALSFVNKAVPTSPAAPEQSRAHAPAPRSCHRRLRSRRRRREVGSKLLLGCLLFIVTVALVVMFFRMDAEKEAERVRQLKSQPSPSPEREVALAPSPAPSDKGRPGNPEDPRTPGTEEPEPSDEAPPEP